MICLLLPLLCLNSEGSACVRIHAEVHTAVFHYLKINSETGIFRRGEYITGRGIRSFFKVVGQDQKLLTGSKKSLFNKGQGKKWVGTCPEFLYIAAYNESFVFRACTRGRGRYSKLGGQNL